MKFSGEFGAFYKKCLSELKTRPDWTEAYLPMLERYVFITMKAAALGQEIEDEEVEVTSEHTNRAKETNEVTSPKWRMYLLLDKQSNTLARELKLSPINAPVVQVKEEEDEGFDTSLKIAK